MNRITQIRRHAYESVSAQDYVAACSWILTALRGYGFQPADCANLAYVAFNYCDRPTREEIFDQLIAAGARDLQTTAPTFLTLSFELDLGVPNAKKLVKRRFIDRILAPEIVARPKKPIVFWHIPKCSGTSLNTALGAFFYRSPASKILPSYNYRPLVSFLMREALGEIPYMPSMHFGLDEVTPQADHFSFSVLRDPIKRCVSMYRQEAANNAQGEIDQSKWHHYRTFPRYGAFWDYRKDKSFENWLSNIPGWLLARQLTTFSVRNDVPEAVSRIQSLDYVIARDLSLGSEMELFHVLDLKYSPDNIPKDLNRSDKSIAVPEDAAGLLAEHLGQEYEMLAKVQDAMNVSY